MKKAKIATCCHCGARAVLDVAHLKKVRLICESCGAPLTRLAPLKTEDRDSDRRDVERRPQPGGYERSRKNRHEKNRHEKKRYEKKRTPRKGRKRKSLFWEVLDEIEDIFD